MAERDRRRRCAPRRAPTTSCGRSRPAGRARRRASPAWRERAGYGLVLTPMFEDAAPVPPGHRRRERRRHQGDVRVRRPRRAAGWPCAPRARPRSCGPSSSTTRRCRGRPGTSRRPSATSGPRRAATASTTSWAWRRSAPTTPTSTSRSSRWPPPSTTALGLRRVDARGQLDGVRASAGPPTSMRSPRTCDEHADELCDEHRERCEPTRCGCSTASGRQCRAVTDGAPASSTISTRRAPPTSPGCARASTRSASPTSSTPGSCGASTTTPAPPSSSPREASTSAQNAVGGGGRYDGLAEASGARRPRASASASASSGCCSPATPRGCSAVDPPLPDVFVVDLTGGDRGARLCERAAPARGSGPSAPSTAAR